LLRKVILIVVGILFGLGMCELAARIVVPMDPALRYNLARRRHNAAMRGQFYAHDAELGWRTRARAGGRFDAPDFSSVVSTGARGFRTQPSRPGDAPRAHVLMLGDSVVFGYGVDDAATFSARLQATHPELDIVNMGVAGYGTDQELLLLRRELAQLDRSVPTTVVVTFYLNDLIDNVSKLRGGYAKPYFAFDAHDHLTLAGQPVPLPNAGGEASALDDELAAHLRSYALVRPRITNLAIRLGLLSAEEGVDDYLGFFVRADAEQRASQWRMWRAIMDQMDADVRAAGAKLTVVVMPVRTQVVSAARARLCRLYGYDEAKLSLDEPEQEIRRWGDAHAVPVLTLLEPLRAFAARGPSPYFEFDLHPNALGHQVIAAALESLLPRTP
jgi:lysophospholipase L1-like esterase